MKTKICVVGLGYVGLPLILNLSQKFECIGFDVSKNRIMNLKIKKDTNKEFKPQNFEKKKLYSHRKLMKLKNVIFILSAFQLQLQEIRNLT